MSGDAGRPDELARQAIRPVLAGNAPNGTAPGDCGTWAPIVQAIFDGYATAGTIGAIKVYEALSSQDPAVARLLASDPEQVTVHRAVEAWVPRPVIPEIIADLIGAGTISLFFGPPGCGKTFILIDMTVCIAMGWSWLGMATAAGPVLWIDEESGDRRFKDRLERTMRGHGIAPGTDLPVFWTSLEGFDLRTAKPWLELLHKLIDETGARLVIVDALADVMMGADENAVKDTQPVFHGLRGLAEATGAAFIMVHHTNKAGGYRGSTAIPGAVDLALGVSRLADDGPLKIETVKSRDLAPLTFGCRGAWDLQTESFRLDPVDLKPAGPILTGSQQFVMRFLRDQGREGADMATIRNNADSCTEVSAQKAVFELVKRGLIRRIDGGKSGSKGVWAITPEDPQKRLGDL